MFKILQKNFPTILIGTLFTLMALFMALMPVHAVYNIAFNSTTGTSILQTGDVLHYNASKTYILPVTFSAGSTSSCKGDVPHNMSCWVENGSGSYYDVFPPRIDYDLNPATTTWTWNENITLVTNLTGCNRLFCYMSCNNTEAPIKKGVDLAYFIVAPNTTYIGRSGNNQQLTNNNSIVPYWAKTQANYGTFVFDTNYVTARGTTYSPSSPSYAYLTSDSSTEWSSKPTSKCYTDTTSYWQTDTSWVGLTGGECCFMETSGEVAGAPTSYSEGCIYFYDETTSTKRFLANSAPYVYSWCLNGENYPASTNHNSSYSPTAVTYTTRYHRNIPFSDFFRTQIVGISSSGYATAEYISQYYYDSTFESYVNYSLNWYNPLSGSVNYNTVIFGYSINVTPSISLHTWNCNIALNNASGTQQTKTNYPVYGNTINNGSTSTFFVENLANGAYYFNINCYDVFEPTYTISTITTPTFFLENTIDTCAEIGITTCTGGKVFDESIFPTCCSCPNTCTYGYVGGTCSCYGCTTTCPDGYLQQDYPDCTCYQTCSDLCGAWNVLTENPCVCRKPYNGGYCSNHCTYGYGAGIGNCTCLGKPNPPFSDYWVINDTSTFVSKILSDSPNLIIILGMITLLVVILISIVLLIKAIGGSLGGVIGDR